MRNWIATLGVAALAGILCYIGFQTTESLAQSNATATPTPRALVHSATGCRFVANDLELLKAMYHYRNKAFPATPDIAREYFFDDEGNGISASWIIHTVYNTQYTPTDRTLTGEAAYQQYLSKFHLALRQARQQLLSVVRFEGIARDWELSYSDHAHTFTHADWYLLDMGQFISYEITATTFRAGFPVCYHLDTNPQPAELNPATSTPTPESF